jgi:hypothetical protein
MAGSDSRPYLPESTHMRIESAPDVNLAELNCGKLQGNLYVNSSLSLSYQFPEDWFAAHNHTCKQLPKFRPRKKQNIPARKQGRIPSDACACSLSFPRYDEHNRALDFNPRITLLAADPTCFIPEMKFPTSLEKRVEVEGYGQALVHAHNQDARVGHLSLRDVCRSHDGNSARLRIHPQVKTGMWKVILFHIGIWCCCESRISDCKMSRFFQNFAFLSRKIQLLCFTLSSLCLFVPVTGSEGQL